MICSRHKFLHLRPSFGGRTLTRPMQDRRAPALQSPQISRSRLEEIPPASHRCHRCEQPLRMGVPAHRLGDGAGRSPGLQVITPSSGLPSFPVAIADGGSPLTVAGAATDKTALFAQVRPCSLFPPRGKPGNQHVTIKFQMQPARSRQNRSPGKLNPSLNYKIEGDSDLRGKQDCFPLRSLHSSTGHCHGIFKFVQSREVYLRQVLRSCERYVNERSSMNAKAMNVRG
jgi:hypothetical protein